MLKNINIRLSRIYSSHFLLFFLILLRLALRSLENFSLNSRTLNLSKSVKFSLLACLAMFWSNVVLLNAYLALAFEIAFLNLPVLIPCLTVAL